MSVQHTSGGILSVPHIKKRLSPFARSVCGGKIEVFKTIDSTNTEAKRRLTQAVSSDALHGTVLIAEHQSAGRGRLGRSFFSPAESGIYLSLIYKPECGANDGGGADTALLTAFAAVSVCRALSDAGIQSGIKWVNDVLINGKKVCGILTEGFIREKEIDAVITGVGINVYKAREGFPAELQDIAGSLSENAAEAVDRNALAALIISHIIEAFSGKSRHGTCARCSLMDEYKRRSLAMGKRVRVISAAESYEATVTDITDEAHLVVKDLAGNVRELLSGEISIRL